MTQEEERLHDDLVLMMNERNKAAALLKESEAELELVRSSLEALRAEVAGLRHNWEMAVSDGLRLACELKALRAVKP